MRKKITYSFVGASVALLAVSAPVTASLRHAGASLDSTQTASIGGSSARPAASCGPVYVPKMIHERDGSIVGMTYVMDGDDC